MTQNIYKHLSHIYSVKKELFLDCLKLKSLKQQKQRVLFANLPILKSNTRWSRILPIMSHMRIFIVNGRAKNSFFLPIQDRHITFRLGEFLATRKTEVKHKKYKLKVKIKPKEIMIKRTALEASGVFRKKMKKRYK